jgi:hypothetical protein
MVKIFAGKMTLAEKHWPAWQLGMGRCFLVMAVWLRSRGLRCGAALTRRDRWRQSAQEWSMVWERRKEWLHGYPDPSQTIP